MGFTKSGLGSQPPLRTRFCDPNRFRSNFLQAKNVLNYDFPQNLGAVAQTVLEIRACKVDNQAKKFGEFSIKFA